MKTVKLMQVMNFSEGARELKVTHQRFSRLIKGLGVPFQRSGYTLLFERSELPKLRAEIRRLKGKKKKAEAE